jgi:Domain of unknown function (DUF1707)
VIEGDMAGPGDKIRASDAERDAVIEMLRRHTADGRLTMAEFEERVAEAYAARTRGDLDPVLRELPPLQASPPAGEGRDAQRRRAGRRESAWSARGRRGSLVALLPRVALIAAVIAFGTLMVTQGAWWIVFPLFWIVGGASGRGMACGARHHSTHARGARHRHADDETIRV